MDHEMQRIQKLQMFDEQMKRLDLQQRQEDKDILKNSALGPISPPNNNPTSKSSPSSRSLPGSRRNSGSEDNPDVLDFDNKLKLSDNEQRYSLIGESDIDEKIWWLVHIYSCEFFIYSCLFSAISNSHCESRLPDCSTRCLTAQ
jgi:hypothetical protein